MALPLAGKVAVVTGASRGVGKGVALELGAAGATVYVTGRSVTPGSYPVPGTVTETAAEVTALGGQGIAVRCDHAVDADSEALFERVRSEQDRIDILVNNAFPTPLGAMPVELPIWEWPLDLWDQIMAVALRSHLIAARLAAPLMVAQGSGLIVEVSSPTAVRPRPSGFAVDSIAKAGQQRLMEDLARMLRVYNIAVLALWPGWVRTEKNEAQPDRWPPEVMERFANHGESPRYSGRAVVALATDPDVMSRSGLALSIGELAEAYDFTDLDGRRPDPWADLVAQRSRSRSA